AARDERSRIRDEALVVRLEERVVRAADREGDRGLRAEVRQLSLDGVGSEVRAEPALDQARVVEARIGRRPVRRERVDVDLAPAQRDRRRVGAPLARLRAREQRLERGREERAALLPALAELAEEARVDEATGRARERLLAQLRRPLERVAQRRAVGGKAI